MSATPHQETFRDNFIAHKGSFFIGFVCLILSYALLSMAPRLIGDAVNIFHTHAVANQKPKASLPSEIKPILLWLVGIVSLQAIFRVLSRFYIFNSGRRIEYEIRGRLLSHVLTLPMLTLNRLGVGDIMSRLTNDLANVRAFFGFGILNIVGAPVRLIAALIQMTLLSPTLTLVTAFPLIIITLMVRKFGYPLFDLNRKIATRLGQMTASVQETLAQITTIKLFGQEKARANSFKQRSDAYLEMNMIAAKQRALLFPFTELIFGLGALGIIVLGGWLNINQAIEIGVFTSFLLYLKQLEEPVRLFGFVFGNYTRGKAAMDRLNSLFAVVPDINWGTGSDPEAFKQDISVENLQLILGDRPVVDGITLTIKSGQMVGITGPVGAGKSSLLNLLARVLDPNTGEIRLGDHSPDWFSADSWRAGLGYATQEPFLFADTIEENIRFGDPEAPREKVMEAAEFAGLTADLNRFEKGLDTIVGERGITLSGGQKQRVSLARALMSAPPILLLDDSFSAVDTLTESNIIQGLRKAGEHRTIVFATHRLSAMPYCDQIFVLDKGKVIQQGKHEVLLSEPGLYQELWNRQKLEESLA